MSNMKLKLLPPKSKACPQGFHRARFYSAKPPNKPAKRICKDQIQLSFVVEHDHEEYVVYKKFCAEFRPGNELHAFLDSWLGDYLERYFDDDWQIEFDKLVDKEADVEVGHCNDGQNAEPYVQLLRICPAGILVDDAELIT